jgi:hypothetical protein
VLAVDARPSWRLLLGRTLPSPFSVLSECLVVVTEAGLGEVVWDQVDVGREGERRGVVPENDLDLLGVPA